MQKRKLLCMLLCMVLAVFTMAACGDSTDQTKDQGTGTTETSGQKDDSSLGRSTEVREFSSEELLSGKHHVQMEIQDHGTVTLELDADQAPISVTNFIELAKGGLYNGLTFHRIIAGQFAQGGDPNGDGTGGPGYCIKGEFAANGVDNTLSHTRGAISMARTSDYNGGGCQFFIMDADYTGFDGQYACFGYVTDGMDVIDEICTTTPATDNNGSISPSDQPVITSVTVID